MVPWNGFQNHFPCSSAAPALGSRCGGRSSAKRDAAPDSSGQSPVGDCSPGSERTCRSDCHSSSPEDSEAPEVELHIGPQIA